MSFRMPPRLAPSAPPCPCTVDANQQGSLPPRPSLKRFGSQTISSYGPFLSLRFHPFCFLLVAGARGWRPSGCLLRASGRSFVEMKADFSRQCRIPLASFLTLPRPASPASKLDVSHETMRAPLDAHGDQSVHPPHRLPAPLESRIGSSGNVGIALPLAAAALCQQSL